MKKETKRLMLVIILTATAVLWIEYILGVYSNVELGWISALIFWLALAGLHVVGKQKENNVPKQTIIDLKKGTVTELEWWNRKDVLGKDNYDEAYKLSRRVKSTGKRPKWTAEQLVHLLRWCDDAEKSYLSEKESHVATYVYIKYLQKFGSDRTYKSVLHRLEKVE